MTEDQIRRLVRETAREAAREAVRETLHTLGVDADSPAIQDYFARHTEFVGTPPDSWASAITYASLEMLAQAVERVGLDHEALANALSTGTFQTVVGDVTLEDNQLRDLWWVGQWQGGDFRAVNPAARAGASVPVIPKPQW